MTNSKRKGKGGEQEFSNFLKERGIEARRGQQFKGTPDSPDIISELDDIHWEVKRVEKLYLYDSLKKAIGDAGDDQKPVVAYRKNREEWVCILRADDFLNIVKNRRNKNDKNKQDDDC